MQKIITKRHEIVCESNNSNNSAISRSSATSIIIERCWKRFSFDESFLIYAESFHCKNEQK